MPYLYQVQIREKSSDEKGVFALEDIPEGVALWIAHTNDPTPPILGIQTFQNRVLSKEQVSALQAQGKAQEITSLFQISTYYADQDVVLECRDGIQFTNHSENANTKCVNPASKNYKDIKSITLRKISKGEELFENYAEYQKEPEWVLNFIKKYNPERLQYYAEVLHK